MIIAINYADKNFEKSQKFNTKTAYRKGKVDHVIEFTPNDIDNKFYIENKEVLDMKRGGGYWLWKPYILLKTINKYKYGDYIFYCDSGAYYIDKVEYLIDSLDRSGQDIMIFELPLIEKQWTKKKVFDSMKCNKKIYTDTNQRLATYILLKISDRSKKFFEEYLYFCKEKDLLIDYNNEGIDSDFIDSRHDQSILSLLSKKYKIEAFRDPSQYGIRPWEYINSDRLYNKKIYKNSYYPQILVSYRKDNLLKFRIKEFIKRTITRFNLLNEEQFIKKNNIKRIKKIEY
ncbi:hypothetical protein [Clostridium baratii]|uniref:hypothetical protein n=1 Tax=Clostridium baratii TaxID=1561 RepID=UPI001CAFB37C|nr:hypothetical protein [Clostridium baratii]STA98788.1 Uncharacterised protein [Clostridium baratii]